MKTAYFTKEEEAAIVAAIQQAESHTSGEIRVHVEKTCKIDPYEKAAFWFRFTGGAKKHADYKKRVRH